MRPARTAALRVRVTLDGRTRPARLDRTTGTVRVPAVRLRPGRHRVRVSVAAGRGASVTRAWAFTVRRC
jgi:hypothetical protein